MTSISEKMEDYIVKLDIRKFYKSIGTEELRALRDDITQELKTRNATRDYSQQKPMYRYWKGSIIKRRGNALCRYSFCLEPVDADKLPQEVLPMVTTIFFRLLSGAFRKDTCPKIGDVVLLKYRDLKNSPASESFRRSRIIEKVPDK